MGGAVSASEREDFEERGYRQAPFRINFEELLPGKLRDENYSTQRTQLKPLHISCFFTFDKGAK